MSDDFLPDIERAAKARALMEDPLMVEAFSQLEKELIESWQRETDWKQREEIWHQQKALQQVHTYLMTRLQQKGMLAQRKLQKANQ